MKFELVKTKDLKPGEKYHDVEDLDFSEEIEFVGKSLRYLKFKKTVDCSCYKLDKKTGLILFSRLVPINGFYKLIK